MRMRSSILVYLFVSTLNESGYALNILRSERLFLDGLFCPWWNHGTTACLSIATVDHNILYNFDLNMTSALWTRLMVACTLYVLLRLYNPAFPNRDFFDMPLHSIPSPCLLSQYILCILFA